MPETSLTTGRSRRAGGFTLVEVMVALGILAIALPMVAAGLVSGMLENQESVENTMSNLLAENAISLLRIRARDSDFAPTWGAADKTLSSPTNRVPDSVIDPEDCVYAPFGQPSSFAFVILGQRLEHARNDYRFVVLVYRRIGDAKLSAARVEFTSGGVSTDKTKTYVRVTGQGAGESALLSTYVVRMSLRS